MKRQNKFLISATFSLLSFGSIAEESYTCELNSTKTKGWIPSTIHIRFNDDQQVTKIWSPDYSKYDLDTAKVIRYTKNFREIKYLDTWKSSEGKRFNTIHTITILPKLDNKISYTMQFKAARNNYVAKGTCKKK